MSTIHLARRAVGGAALVLAPFLWSASLGPATAQAPATPDAAAQQCAALAATDFSGLPDAPTSITSARIVEVPPDAPAPLGSSVIKRYCQVLGYVAPQNKFELRMPMTAQWNQRFHFTACGGFCGALNGNGCNPTLARGYASITSNGGHEGAAPFDGVWAANAPELQDDLGWRNTHVVTLAGKAITSKYYGQPIARSYMTGCSKGGQAVLAEAQRFPEDYDALISAAPVYDFTGRTTAGAWWARVVSDGRGGSVITPEAAAAINKSVLARCGAQAGTDEGLVTNPAACDWRPEMAACTSSSESPTCGPATGGGRQGVDESTVIRKAGLRLFSHSNGDGLRAGTFGRAAGAARRESHTEP